MEQQIVFEFTVVAVKNEVYAAINFFVPNLRVAGHTGFPSRWFFAREVVAMARLRVDSGDFRISIGPRELEGEPTGRRAQPETFAGQMNRRNRLAGKTTSREKDHIGAGLSRVVFKTGRDSYGLIGCRACKRQENRKKKQQRAHGNRGKRHC